MIANHGSGVDVGQTVQFLDRAGRRAVHPPRLPAPGPSGTPEHPQRCQWLTIPTHLPHGRRTAIRDALIVDPVRSRLRTGSMLRQHYAASPYWPVLDAAMTLVLERFSTGRIADVAEVSTRILLDLLGWQGQVLRSSRLPSRPGRSQRLADLASATGAGSYLCGTGGMRYLDPDLFTTAGISVTPFRTPADTMWAFGHRTSAVRPLMHLGPQALAGRLLANAATQRTFRPTG
ncbi:WbqC family protein [Streptomyces sp. NBC_01023]|nr:WbqC family protein [Streptomyces sp. NBC_01023]